MELIAVIALFALFGLALLGVLKLLVWLVLLPIKFGIFLFKGLFGLLIVIPLLLVWTAAASVVPVVLGLLVLPVIVVVLGVVALARAVF